MSRKWYTPTEVAKSLGLSQWSVTRLIRLGRLDAVRTGPHAYHITPEAILKLAHARARAGKNAQSE